MFFTMRKNFRPFPNYSTFSEYIMKTNNKFYNSIKKDCENYIFKKRMHELISNDIASNTTNSNNTSLINYSNDYPYNFFIITITTFSISIYSFLYFYRFKK